MSITKTVYAVDTKAPVKQVHIGNESETDNSGYLGLILNVNKNGKAIRMANRFNENRVYILKSEVPALIEALNLLLERGVATSVKDVVYDDAA